MNGDMNGSMNFNNNHMKKKLSTKNKIINLNQIEFESKLKTINYLVPMLYLAFYYLVLTIVYVMRLVKWYNLRLLIGFGFILYVIMVANLLYGYRKKSNISKNIDYLSDDTARQFVRDIIPKDFFKCPAHCKKKHRD